MSRDRDHNKKGRRKIKKTSNSRPTGISLKVSNVTLVKLLSTFSSQVPRKSQG